VAGGKKGKRGILRQRRGGKWGCVTAYTLGRRERGKKGEVGFAQSAPEERGAALRERALLWTGGKKEKKRREHKVHPRGRTRRGRGKALNALGAIDIVAQPREKGER